MRTYCPQCGTPLEAGDEHVGQQAQCPNCQALFVIPTPTPPRPDTAQAAGAAGGEVPLPGPVPGPQDWAPDIVIWTRQQGAARSEPLAVGDLVLGPEGLAIIGRGAVPTKEIKGDQPGPGAWAAAGILGGAIGGAMLAYAVSRSPGAPGGPSIQTTDASQLRRVFKQADKKRRAERDMPLARRLTQNGGSGLIPYGQILGIEVLEAGAVRLLTEDRAYYLGVHGGWDAFLYWLMRLSALCGRPCIAGTAVKASADRIHVTCPGCGRAVGAPRNLAGRPARCMYCGASLPVPAQEDQAAAPAQDPREHIIHYLTMMAQGQLEQARRFVEALPVGQRRLAADAIGKLRPDELTHPDLAAVPPPVLRRFMDQMRAQLPRPAAP